MISIHAPRTGSDMYIMLDKQYFTPFQSTLPARGATPLRLATLATPFNFNPRSPHGERRGSKRNEAVAKRISIHAPRTGSDTRVA